MERKQQPLKCPVCGKEYDNYKEYFACWTSHLNEKVGTNVGFPPTDHADAIKFYGQNPEQIEKGLRILAEEIGVFRGRIDLVGVDRDKNLVIIDVTSGADWKRKGEQLRRYRKNIEWMAKKIFGLRESPRIRLLVVKPRDYVRDVTISVSDA
jgi:hypothetical protein